MLSCNQGSSRKKMPYPAHSDEEAKPQMQLENQVQRLSNQLKLPSTTTRRPTICNLHLPERMKHNCPLGPWRHSRQIVQMHRRSRWITRSRRSIGWIHLVSREIPFLNWIKLKMFRAIKVKSRGSHLAWSRKIPRKSFLRERCRGSRRNWNPINQDAMRQLTFCRTNSPMKKAPKSDKTTLMLIMKRYKP